MNEIDVYALERFDEQHGIAKDDLKFSGYQILLLGKPLSQWHEEMWAWLAENPQHNKQDFLNIHFESHPEILRGLKNASSCFACLYDNILSISLGEEIKCDHCPIRESLNALGWVKCDGIYFTWGQCKIYGDFSRASEYAKTISELEWEW